MKLSTFLSATLLAGGAFAAQRLAQLARRQGSDQIPCDELGYPVTCCDGFLYCDTSENCYRTPEGGWGCCLKGYECHGDARTETIFHTSTRTWTITGGTTPPMRTATSTTAPTVPSSSSSSPPSSSSSSTSFTPSSSSSKSSPSSGGGQESTPTENNSSPSLPTEPMSTFTGGAVPNNVLPQGSIFSFISGLLLLLM